jgi:3-methyladenine DNA glycosylase AlkD
MKPSLAIEIEEAIRSAAEGRQPQPERRFHKHDEYISYGLYTADFWKIMKSFKTRVLALELDDRLVLAESLLAEHIGEFGHAGIHVLALSVNDLEPTNFSSLDKMMDDFRSWSHVDHYCTDVIKPLLFEYPGEILKLLEMWNQSSNRFKRRASVVAFTRGVASSGHYTDEALKLCENLIWDPEDIVQKGVGWALKDNMRTSPERVKIYIKKLRSMGVPSTITLYAIRDLKGEERQEILAVKKGSPVSFEIDMKS